MLPPSLAGESGGNCPLEMRDEAARLVRLRDRIIEEIQSQIPNAYLIGHRYKRLPGHICLGLADRKARPST